MSLLLFVLQWQQHVSYDINVYLNTEEHSLTAYESLTYYNNSPYSLETLYIHLYANALRDDKTTFAQEMRRLNYEYTQTGQTERGYIEIHSILSEGETLDFTIDETIMAVPLDRPLKAGDSTTLKIDFFVKIPTTFNRIGYRQDHYEIVQWYPKVCVFDKTGWHREPYHAIGEFYGEFGSFNVEIDVPGNYVVAATGERIDKKDREFLESLIVHDKKLFHGDRKKVRFRAENVHDFAWICDPNFKVKKYTADDTDIYVFYIQRHEGTWKNAGHYALDALTRYNEWYGMYPYKNLSIVEGFYRDGMEYPNLVIIGIKEDPLTRGFELVVIHEIAHQWFYGVLGSNEVDEPWLDEGFASYTELRYFEDKYGKENSLVKLPFVPSFSRLYYHKLFYYVVQTNGIEKPVLTPAYEYLDMAVAYTNSAYSKPALFLYNLEGILGKEIFNRILRRYFREFKFRHPTSEDFIAICEQESGQNVRPLFSQFLYTTDFCDWAVKSVEENSVAIENKGSWRMPVDVFVEAEKGAQVYRIDGSQKVDTIVLPEASGNVQKVTIDPYGYSLEPNHWNNHYPRKIEIKPILNLPSFDAYRIFYLPYIWYGSDDGITVGLYLFGAQFVDFDYIRGKHEWTFGTIYGIRSKKVYPGFMYQTPVSFTRGMRTRIRVMGSNSNDEDKLGAGLIYNIGVPFSSGPQRVFKTMLSYYRLNSFRSVDSIDWDTGRIIALENQYTYTYRGWQLDLGLSFTDNLIGSEWSYIKAFTEVKKEIHTVLPFHVRLFAGKIFGSAPAQEQFFLSGALRISLLADLLFAQKGYFSPQEHIHIRGGGAMRGYQTLHIKSDQLYCVNLEFPSRSLIRFFVDFGYYGDFALDVGASIVLGPLSFNFPFYTHTDEPWKFRWSIGF